MVPVPFPDALALLLDFLPGLELRKQKSSQEIGRKVARPNINPAVFINLAAEELASVRALFPDNQRALHEVRVVHQQSAALSAGNVLGLVKALRGQASKRARVLPP